MKYSKNLKHNILSTCEHPIKIHNKYIDEDVYVPCGKCKTCTLHKVTKYSQLCSIEEASYRYCYFVTLTYAPEFVPVCRLVSIKYNDSVACYRDYDGNILPVDDDCADDDYYKFDLVAASPDRPEYGTVMHAFCGYSETVVPPKHLRDFIDKCKLGGFCSYLCPSDLQKFLKRLRKNVSKYTDSKIRYFACGEYGPLHYRCHWHILLYFDDREISKNIIQDVCKSWKYGRVDCSASRGKTSSYVAGYVNSTCSLPSALETKLLRPKNYHSFSFGFKMFEEDKEEIYENGLEYFNAKVHSIGGEYTTVQCPDRLRHYLYPRCVGFTGSSYEELLKRYTVFDWCRRVFKGYDDSEIVSIISYMMMDVYTPTCNNERYLVDYFKSLYTQPEILLLAVPEEEIVYKFVYSVIRTSRHFIKFVCDGDAGLYRQRLNQIISFYKDLDYSSLKNWYEAQSEYGTYDDDFSLFYDANLFSSTDNELRSNRVYNYVLTENYIRWRRSFKHKELNDANEIFTSPININSKI